MNYRMIWALVLTIVLVPVCLFSQEVVPLLHGKVVDIVQPDVPMVGVNLVWLGTEIGASTNEEGEFIIETSDVSRQLIISYVGYATDTIEVTGNDSLLIRLQQGSVLQGTVDLGAQGSSLGDIGWNTNLEIFPLGWKGPGHLNLNGEAHNFQRIKRLQH